MIDGLIVNAVVVPEIILHPETQVVPRLPIIAQTVHGKRSSST